MQKLLIGFHFLILILISSCGSIIKNKSDVISIDSDARGYQILDAENKSLGVTPFFLESRKKRTNTYYLLAPNKNENQNILQLTNKCDFDFNESILPNTLTSIIAWPIGIIAFSVDLYNGSLFLCKNPLYVKNLPKIEKETKPMEALILPPSVNSYKASNLIIDSFLKNNSQLKDRINFKRHDNELAELGISPYSKNNKNATSLVNLHALMLNKKITHVLFFNIETQNGHFKASPVLVDAFTKTETLVDLKNAEVDYENVSYLNFIIEKFRIIPNSIKISETKFSDSESYLKTSRHPKAFPKFLTSLSIGSVYDPAKYSSWDFDVYSGPNFSIPSWKWTYEGNTYLYQSVIATLNGGLLFKTPIGAFSAEMGFGGLYFYERPSSAKNDFQTCINVNLSYVFYFSRKLFFHATTQIYSPSSIKFNNKEASLQQAYVGIGYFFPTLDSLIQEKLLN